MVDPRNFRPHNKGRRNVVRLTAREEAMFRKLTVTTLISVLVSALALATSGRQQVPMEPAVQLPPEFAVSIASLRDLFP
jgi:hypothetical protein